MGNIIRAGAIALMAMLMAVSCSRKDDFRPGTGEDGFLSLSLSCDYGVVEVKAPEAEPVFRIIVSDAGSGEVVETVDDHRTLEDSPLSLKEGRYTVEAVSGEEAEAAFGTPIYKGTQTVDVTAGENTQAEIVCTLANVKVTVTVSENVRLNFSGYDVTVSNGNEGGSLVFAGETLASEGYFKCTGVLDWSIALVNTDGQEYSQSGQLKNVQPRDYYNLNFDISTGTSEGGGLTVEVTVDGTLNDKEYVVDIIEIPVQYVEVTTGKVNPWAKFAYVSGTYTTESVPDGLAFQYRRTSDADWTDFEGDITYDGKSFSARITGLEPQTEYEVRAVTAQDRREDNKVSFTTEAAEQLPNFNFDSWYKDGKNWYANADMEDNYFWDSGNKGANLIGEANPTSPEESFVVSGKAVKMETKTVMSIMAGGNIYSGSFGSVAGLGASINFGRPYTCRPTALHGWYSYAPVAIDKVKAPYENLKGTMDVGKIYVALTDWSSPFNVNTNTGTFFVPDEDPAVIAYGEIEIPDNSNGEYKEFTINLEYRDLERIPTHVLVVATASKYADYFTGGVGSTMYIDEFEFLFE
ncbi:MAG TPA: PCMD domain-containing protein [Candidatus Coprenecus stercoravium]|uniref:PCMD domain-containing protein n=1 Tax=Candidatus Coprenecus stercoravium TaxID=2840735 RepID=A0A9D2GRJ7_9BACT|nr:PCMD domain-containing protein [Candidatus Coprenecus stercoravium]